MFLWLSKLITTTTGLLLGYITMGSICYAVMVGVYVLPCLMMCSKKNQVSLGEMVSFLPIPGGHIKLAERFVDPSLSFAMGWNYWLVLPSATTLFRLICFFRYNWTVVLPAELSAAAVLVAFWDRELTVNPAVWVAVTMVVVIIINFLGAGGFKYCVSCWWCSAVFRCIWRGRIHIFVRYFIPVPVYTSLTNNNSSIKVITIVGLIILGIVLDLGGKWQSTMVDFRKTNIIFRWTHSWPPWIQILEKPRTICSIQWYSRSQRSIPWLVGCHDTSSVFLHWYRNCCSTSRRIILCLYFWLIFDRSLLPKQRIPGETSLVQLNVSISVSRFYITLSRISPWAGILLFYIGGTAVISVLVPSNESGLRLGDGTAASSPFVIAITNSGIKVLPHVSI